jgi:NADPH2:quinone reductase
MQAVLCRQYGPPDQLVVAEVPAPVAAAGQVLIEVRAAGVNFPDSLIVKGEYQTKPELPFAPGSEVAGVVRAVAADVADFAVGDRVIAFTGIGGFAGAVAVDASRVWRIPDSMDFVSGAAFVIAYGTSHHALKDRAALQPGETLLVLGAAGGVGLTAIQIGKALGARVIAAASSADKLALCRAHGADELIDYRSEDLRARLKTLTAGNGVDVVYDPVGGDYAEPVLRSMAFLGRYLVIGFAAGSIPKIPLNLPLLKVSAIIGVFWGAFARARPQHNRENFQELFAWYAQGKLKPHISATYPLARAAEAITAVMNREAKGKVVLEV